MDIKQLYNDNLRKLPNEYGDVSVMYRRVTTQSGLTQLFKMSGYRFSGDKNLEQTFASEGSGAVRVDFDCTLILHVEAIKQKAGEVSLSVHSVKNGTGEVRHGVISYEEDTRKNGYLIKLTHTGRFCKNDIILIKFTNVIDIRVTIFGN